MIQGRSRAEFGGAAGCAAGSPAGTLAAAAFTGTPRASSAVLYHFKRSQGGLWRTMRLAQVSEAKGAMPTRSLEGRAGSGMVAIVLRAGEGRQ